MFSGVCTACFRGFLQSFRAYPQQSFGADLRGETCQISGVVMTRFRSCMQHFFKVGATWEENWAFAEDIKVSEWVSLVGLESLWRGNVCRRGRDWRFEESTSGVDY